MTENYPILTLIPPLLAIGLAIATRKVLISLGLGVLAAAILIAEFDPLATLREVWSSFAVIFWDEGAVNTWYVYILIFLLLLGAIAAFIMMSGGTRALADWAITRVTSRRGAQGVPAVLGLIIFIDDYFNALAVGQVSRPVTDKHRVSRAKLAYIVDSTSAPVAVLAPFSSWGAYIMGLIAPLVAASALTMGSLEAFLRAAAANFYAIAAVVLVWVIVLLRLDVGPMRKEERRALTEGKVYADGATIPGELAEDLPVHYPGVRRALVVPFLALVLGVFAGLTLTGYRAAGTWDWVAILADTDASAALVLGGLIGLAFALYYYFRNTSRNPDFSASEFGRGWLEGIKSMLPAIAILLLAWTLGDLIGALGTGEYLGDLVERADMPPAWLIPVMFVVASLIAFATGTSWGSFGLLLPIAGAIMTSVNQPELLLPAFGAVLAGAVLGDHVSPISDTTILSSTGAGANVITHVVTQVPYAIAAGVAALAGYAVLALTGSVLAGLAATFAAIAAFVLIGRARSTPLDEQVTTDRTIARG
ncbi:Na+/H+ antiporter NhaC family protein [Pseudactinotalea sp. Z1739]|uniref:Na+/H+ antiporter NhaC family protein n=1 Tax=Pseudactinotalea sp. Z1739 TaxID=3413028 RepID=UPI003C7E440E